MTGAGVACGLTIVVATADPLRWQSALRMATASAAIGAPVRLFLDEPAVTLLAAPGALLNTALDLAVEVIVCQSGLAAAGLSMTALDPRIGAGGLTSLVASLGEDRLAIC